ncbi:MAG: hypothetical protein KUA35_16515 [Pseudodesulfovibrio sp.]|uniref:hypothetical protein n=1 Tax=Pseudodesulfovibrio TaxID=2035811 RepID=UPI0001BF98FC|nr:MULTISPECIES: hypothetical protein [Pseudodesulfovibrio]MBU4475511.1 hypothetical protein [Pseudomonadota bacterium]MBU4514715.1 hypothetical protein [Pseudomonadota bacterium]MBU4522261.1 hypothetical protein [Pseudomonadota bacterium]MBU4559487.1 hypothetical protein [Pseudomonadota bacterium]MBV1765885.1 hypothetical protein [Pseudodesulfovibrio sp.]
MNAISQDLIDHTIAHFYPEADAHSRIHNSLLQDIRSVLHKFKKKASVADLFNLMAIKIVKNHLLEEDRKFFPYLEPVDPC